MIYVLIDTNVLVSAILNGRSVPYQAYKKATNPPYQCLICEQSLEELRRIFNQKFPDKMQMFERFITTALSVVTLIPVPALPYPDEDEIRDVDDRPILRSAIKNGASILITGDKDFLESAITSPKIMTAAQFVQLNT